MDVSDRPVVTRGRERVFSWSRARQLGSASRLRYATLTVMSALLLAGCGLTRGDDKPSQPSAPATTTGTVSPQQTAGTAHPASTAALSDDEVTWVLAAHGFVQNILLNISNSSQKDGQDVTKKAAQAEAAALRKCRTALTQLGPPPTLRLKPEYDTMVAACEWSDQAAACYITIANNVSALSESGIRKVAEAADCVSAAVSETVTKIIQVEQDLYDVQSQAAS